MRKVDLIIDTETNGLPDLYRPPGDPAHPYLLQLAAILADGAEVITKMELLLAWPDVSVSVEMTKIHGIDAKRLERDGVAPLKALKEFDALVRRADRVVAHNLEFDDLIILIAYCRVGGTGNAFKHRNRICTMQSAKEVVIFPDQDPDDIFHKNPSLAEAYGFLVDEAGFEGAHTALSDAQACHAILTALRARDAKLSYKAPIRRPPADVEMAWVVDVLQRAEDLEDRLTDWERSFVSDFASRSAMWGDGLFVSEKQRAILVRIEGKLGD